MTPYVLVLGISFVVFSTFGGCSDDDTHSGCTWGWQCGVQGVCRSGVCDRWGCDSDDECGGRSGGLCCPDRRCGCCQDDLDCSEAYRCEDGQCERRPEPDRPDAAPPSGSSSCRRDEDCGGKRVCLPEPLFGWARACYPGCSASECGDDERCDPYTGECETVPGAVLQNHLGWVRVGDLEVTRNEITVFQWQQCEHAGRCPHIFYAGHEDQPMVGVSWAEAVGFAELVRGRLPTHQEWSSLAHLEDGAWPWGDEPPSCERVRFLECAAGDGRGRLPPCQLPAGASAEGVCDLIGNVEEWLGDIERDERGVKRVTIGGSHRTPGEALHETLSPERPTDLRAVGFRVVRDAPPAPPP